MNRRGYGSIFVASLFLLSIIGAVPLLAVDAPANLSAQSREGGEIFLTWDAVGGAVGYKVYWSTAPSPPGTEKMTTSDTFATLTITGDSLPANFMIYFWVTAYDGIGESGYSVMAQAACDTLSPPAVTLLAPADGTFVLTDQPTFQWTAVVDSTGSGTAASGLDHYELQYSTSSAFNPSGTATIGNIASTSTSYTPTVHLVSDTFYWRVRAVDAAGNAIGWTSAPMGSFVVNMNSPTQITPASGSYTNNSGPTFSWTQIDGASGYVLNIYDSPSMTVLAFDESLTTVIGGTVTSFIPTFTFADGTYYWKVSATDSTGASVDRFSSVWTVTIDTTPPAAPGLSSPAEAETVSEAPAMSWSAVTGAESYEIEMSQTSATTTDGSFASTYYIYPSGSGTLTTTTHTPTAAFADGTYYWHARALDEAGNTSEWSSMRSLVVDTTLPVAPVPTSPADGTTITTALPTFTWQGVSGATSYVLKYSDSSSFSASDTVTETVTTTSFTVPADDALENDTYYWKVSSSLDTDLFSEVRTLIVDVPASEQPVDFNIIVREGSTGTALEDAAVVVKLGTETQFSGATNEEGAYAVSLKPDSYTLTVTKNLWDDGLGNTYTKTIVVETDSTDVYVNLYKNGNDLLVATVKYNNNTYPQSVSIYRNGVIQSTVQIPNIPTPASMIPSNLQSLGTNLVIEVPTSGSYTIADTSYPDDQVAIVNLSKTLSSATNNLVVFEVTAALSGIAVDEEGGIVTGATVKVVRSSDDSVVASSESTALGFQFTQLLPGTYYLRVNKTGFEDTVTSAFTLAANETKNYGMVTLAQKKGTLNITVQTEEGQLVNNATVEIKDLTQAVVFSQEAAQGIIGTELPSGTYSISASAENYTLYMPVGVVVVADETVSKNVIMVPVEEPPPETGTMQISLSDDQGAPLSLVEVFFGEEKMGATNENGLLLIEDIDPGTYEVTLKKEGYVDTTQSVDIVAGETSSFTPVMEEESEGDTGSRVKWVLIAAIVIIVFAIAVYIISQNSKENGGTATSEPDEPSADAGKEAPATKPVRPVQAKKEEYKRPPGGGIPSTSVKDDTRTTTKRTGGLPQDPVKEK